MNRNRPTNINPAALATLQFPIAAITSILHRITGVILFLSLPIVLWMLSHILESQQSFNELTNFTSSTLGRLVSWGILSVLSYHVFAGLKHLAMDLGYGETLEAGRFNAKLVIVLGVATAIFWGVWIW